MTNFSVTPTSGGSDFVVVPEQPSAVHEHPLNLAAKRSGRLLKQTEERLQAGDIWTLRDNGQWDEIPEFLVGRLVPNMPDCKFVRPNT